MLRWPGGKKKSAQLIMRYAPDKFREFRDPFVGGNGIILAVPDGVRIWLNDSFPWVVDFWKWIRDDPHAELAIMERKELCLSLHDYPEASREMFFRWKFRLTERYDPLDYLSLNLWAVAAIVSPNRNDLASFSSLWKRDGWRHVNANKVRAYRRKLQGAEITLGNYSELLGDGGKRVFTFLDPPYDIRDNNSPIYSHNFTPEQHVMLAENLKRCRQNWLLTIQNNRLVERLYAGHKMRPRQYAGTMVHRSEERKQDKEKTELWIWSY
jgi:DNA adenine methylase